MSVSSAAEQDIAEIAEYIAADNLDAAVRLIDRFTELFQRLAQHGNLGERFQHRGIELRRFSIGNYVVFFQQIDSGIQIVRILHGTRQFEDLL